MIWLIKFNCFSDSFIGVAFPSRFLGFVSCELEHNSTFYVYHAFRSLSIDSIRFLRAQSYIRISNLPYNFNYQSELDYFDILDRASRNFTYSYSHFGRLGAISFGFDKFGFYVAPNLRKITGAVSKKKIIDLGSFVLYQLEHLKDPPDCNNYPINYVSDDNGGCHAIVEGVYYSFESLRKSGSWKLQVFIEMGFRNPKDIMIHPTLNQFKYWSDVFLGKLGIGIYRLT